MIQIEIDGKKLQAEEGTPIIEVADQHGIYIPRYCYHKKLSVVANCRMCLVEVEKSKKPLPACATPVSDGMKVFTQSPLALQAQRDVMSFLLINHPLDCPVCDQGGECELQDLAMGFGRSESEYDQTKRSVKGPELGPLIQTFMTRCIQCTRCVRFGEEIAGKRELGVIHRGEDEAITTAINGAMKTEVSANIIDLCPVGALTAKPIRFSGRSWSYYEHPYIAPHDCVGSHVFLHTLRNDNAETQRVMRVVPREAPSINECWISDRDRFAFMGVDHAERATQPMIKVKGTWTTVSWERLLTELADRLRAIQEHDAANEIAALIGSQATLEEQYLFQKLMRAVGTKNIDSRLRTQDFSDQDSRPLQPGLGVRIEELATADAMVVIGGDIRREQPVLTCRLNQTLFEVERSIFQINSYDTESTFKVTDQSIVSRQAMAATVASLIAAVKTEKGENLSGEWASVEILPAHQAWAKQLLSAEKAVIILGEQVDTLEHAALLRAAAAELAALLGDQTAELTAGANTAGAWLSGCLPHRGVGGAKVGQGDHALAMLSEPRKIYCLFQVEPELDVAAPAQALAALKGAELVVSMTSFVSEAMKEYADFILPVAAFSETPGTFINAGGRQQSFNAATLPAGDVRPGWKVLRVLGNFCQLDGFEQRTVEEVREEIHSAVTEAEWEKTPAVGFDVAQATQAEATLTRVSPYPTAAADAVVRRSEPMQAVLPAEDRQAAVNQATADRLNLQDGCQVRLRQGDSELSLALRIDNKVADQVVYLPAGVAEVAGFGRMESAIAVERISE